MATAAINSTEDNTRSERRSFRIGNSVWALADQMLISGTNFVTMVLLARGLDSAAAFGAFVLVHSILLFSNSIQSALVTQPHNVLGVSKSGANYVRYTSSTALSQLAIILPLAALVFAAWGIALFADWAVAPLLLAMVPTVIAWQLQEFMRRVLYTESRNAIAFSVDLLAYGGQTLAIAVAWWYEILTGSFALYSIAIASTLAALTGCWHLRKSLAWQFDGQVVKENWHFGKWLAGGYIVGNWLSSQLLIFLAAGLLGTWAAGILRAAHTVFGPMRIMTQAFSTTLPITLANSLESHGTSAFRRDVRRAFLLAAPVLGAYCLAAAFFADEVLTLAFGEKYAGYEKVLILYAANAFVGYLCIILAATLRSTRSTRQIFFCELCATFAIVPLSGCLIPFLGIYGVVLGMIFTDLLLLSLLYWTFRTTVRELACRKTDDLEPAVVLENDCDTQLPRVDTMAEGPNRNPRREALLQVFEAFERENIPYCVLHGYEGYPDHVPSDVDCIMPASAISGKLHETLAERLGGDLALVQWVRGGAHGIVLRLQSASAAGEFLQLDISDGCHLNKRVQFYSGEEILRSRQRHKQFWVPAPKIEFGCYLIRRLYKKQLNSTHAARLTQLFRQDSTGCTEQVHRLLGKRGSSLISSAASTGNWSEVQNRLPQLRRWLLIRASVKQPGRLFWNLLAGTGRRVRRWFHPSGFHIALLGPDGAGKSSVAAGVQQSLSPVFLGSTCRSFPPKLLKRQVGNSSQPHDIRPRSKPSSIVRAILYWWTYYSPGYYFTIYPALVKSWLVIHDRHVIDCLIDPVRYRYSGPAWLLRSIWQWMPKPEIVILLDVPAEITQSRKQEVAFEVSARQRVAYRKLVETLPNGCIVDGSQPLDDVVAEVKEMILRNLMDRTKRENDCN